MQLRLLLVNIQNVRLVSAVWSLFQCLVTLFAPTHEILALFVLCKFILQIRMRSHPVGLDVWFLVWPLVYFQMCVKALYHNLMSWLISSPVQSTRRAIVVTPVVRICVRVPITLQQSFIYKFFKSSYLDSHSSGSIHIWTIGTSEGRLSFHDCWPQAAWGQQSWNESWPSEGQAPFPGVGLEVKI